MANFLSMDEQMPQNPPQTPIAPQKRPTPPGWAIVAGIVIIVAAILFLTQKTAPSGVNEATNDEESAVNDESAPTIVDVPATVSFSFVPSSVPQAGLFGIDWQVETAEQTFATKTAIYWDTSSHPGAFGVDVDPVDSEYDYDTTAYSAGYFALPGSFEDNIKLTGNEGVSVIYMRAYVALAGKHYWSEEVAVPVRTDSQSSGS